MMDIEELIIFSQKFSGWDYLMFVVMLFLCILIGIYFGFLRTNNNTEADYLMGGRTMSVIPIALSLVASFISGITLLGLPTEVYSYGIQYVYVMFGVIAMGLVMSYVYLPVFHNLHITSTYEYLESRFDRRVRMFGSVMFTIMNIGYLPIVIYVPALAFNQVTGINVHVITPIVCIVCIFYTCVGGLKAVVWTDVVQTISMLGALILVAVKGTMEINGVGEIFSEALKTDRIEPPNLSLNPTIRHTLWSQVVGGLFYWLQTNAVSQNMIQRYLSLPTLKDARRALYIFVMGVCVVMCLCTYNGLLIYATYKQCDPLTTQLAKARDQLLPLFVMDVLGDLPGLSGIFIAGVFSAALSSLSTCLNSMSAVVLEDFCKPFVKRPLSDSAINFIMRSVVVGVGILCVALVFLVEKLGTVLQLAMSLEAITNGPLLGIFTMGILMPIVNGKSALTGGVVGVIVMSWVSLKSQWAIASGAMKLVSKETSVEDCPYTFQLTNSSVINPTQMIPIDDSDINPLYRVSYMWYTCLGCIITIVVAFLASLAFGRNQTDTVDHSLISPVIRRCYKNKAADSNEVTGIKLESYREKAPVSAE